MAAQPNAATLTAALVTAPQEIALVPNLPTFNNGQNIITAIQAMNTNINNLRTDVTTLTTNVTTLTTDVNTLNTKFDGLELRMRA